MSEDGIRPGKLIMVNCIEDADEIVRLNGEISKRESELETARELLAAQARRVKELEAEIRLWKKLNDERIAKSIERAGK